MGDCETDLKKLASGADIRTGLAIHGSSVSNAKTDIENWILKG